MPEDNIKSTWNTADDFVRKISTNLGEASKHFDAGRYTLSYKFLLDTLMSISPYATEAEMTELDKLIEPLNVNGLIRIPQIKKAQEGRAMKQAIAVYIDETRNQTIELTKCIMRVLNNHGFLISAAKDSKEMF